MMRMDADDDDDGWVTQPYHPAWVPGGMYAELLNRGGKGEGRYSLKHHVHMKL